MRITRRTKAIAFFITLGACLVALAIFLNITWIVFHWRQVVPLVLGIIFFGMIIAGLVVYTIFIVREIRRNERQDSFLNAVTHELKTPITSIRLYLETLQSRALDEVEVDFSAVVRESLELARLRHNLRPENLRFGKEPHEQLAVLGNAEELRTAVFNLIDNAIKYSGDHKDIEVDVLTPDIDTICLNVRDRGIGIPRVELKRIFNRFYRVENAGQVKGTGLGLFIVRSVARRYGGDAYAESEGEGRGSTFTLRLPRVYRA